MKGYYLEKHCKELLVMIFFFYWCASCHFNSDIGPVFEDVHH